MATKKFAPIRYMKRPTYVEAAFLTDDNIKDVAEWIEGQAVIDPIHGKYIVIPKAPAAINRVRVGEYVVRYANGTIARADLDSFLETYTAA